MKIIILQVGNGMESFMGTNQNGEIKNFREVVYSAENQTNPLVNGRLLVVMNSIIKKELDMKPLTGKNQARINNSSH